MKREMKFTKYCHCLILFNSAPGSSPIITGTKSTRPPRSIILWLAPWMTCSLVFLQFCSSSLRMLAVCSTSSRIPSSVAPSQACVLRCCRVLSVACASRLALWLSPQKSCAIASGPWNACDDDPAWYGSLTASLLSLWAEHDSRRISSLTNTRQLSSESFKYVVLATCRFQA